MADVSGHTPRSGSVWHVDRAVVVNPVRPSRTAIEVASLPGPGWLVEIEAVARYGR
jgi:enamine deaminase RidA (YjgF/YER057c/UK114 family)